MSGCVGWIFFLVLLRGEMDVFLLVPCAHAVLSFCFFFNSCIPNNLCIPQYTMLVGSFLVFLKLVSLTKLDLVK